MEFDPRSIQQFASEVDFVAHEFIMMGHCYTNLHSRFVIIAGASGWSVESFIKTRCVFSEHVLAFDPSVRFERLAGDCGQFRAVWFNLGHGVMVMMMSTINAAKVAIAMPRMAICVPVT